jgi:membrane protein implicated in regulation of membrane protease activity
MSSFKTMRSILKYLFATLCGLGSAFFVFYTIRLLYVTQGLTAIRAGSQGTYIGAVAFPVLAIIFGFSSWRLVKSVRKNKETQTN